MAGIRLSLFAEKDGTIIDNPPDGENCEVLPKPPLLFPSLYSSSFLSLLAFLGLCPLVSFLSIWTVLCWLLQPQPLLKLPLNPCRLSLTSRKFLAFCLKRCPPPLAPLVQQLKTNENSSSPALPAGYVGALGVALV